MFSSFRRCRPVFQRRPASLLVNTPARFLSALPLSSTSVLFAPAANERRRQDATAQRNEAWSHFTRASRQLNRAVRTHHEKLRSATDQRNVVKDFSAATVATACVRSGEEEKMEYGDSEDDEALAAIAPAIVRRTSTAAASTVLMRELGVMDRLEFHRPLVSAEDNTVRNDGASTSSASPLSTPLTSTPRVDQVAAQSVVEAPSLFLWSTYLTRVCQTGVQAQVSSCVILKHLWAPFQTLTADAAQRAHAKTGQNEKEGCAPTLQWATRLPSSVRQQLLTHDTARLARRRAYVTEELRGEHAATFSHAAEQVNSIGSDARSTLAETQHVPDASARQMNLSTLSHTWKQTVEDASTVLCCCAAPWLLGDKAFTHDVLFEESSTRPRTAIAALLSAEERNILLASLRHAAAGQAEDVGQQLMQMFVSSVDAVVRRTDAFRTFAEYSLKKTRTHEDAAAELQRSIEAFESWYEADGVAVYEAALTCLAQQSYHATLHTSTLVLSSMAASENGASVYNSAPVHTGNGFARAYSYFVHRGSTAAQLSQRYQEAEEEVDDDDLQSSHVDANSNRRDERNNNRTGVANAEGTHASRAAPKSVWTGSSDPHPVATMQLIAPLAGCVLANADHFHVVLQLYLRVLEETDVAVSREQSTIRLVQNALVALLDALARIPLSSKSKMTLMEDLYHRTLLNATLEVVESPDVLAGCLRVCGAAGVASRATALFNKVAEPSSRGVALQEPNLAAVCLAQFQRSASAVLQSVVSYMQTKLPLTADIVHAGVASLLLNGPSQRKKESAMKSQLTDTDASGTTTTTTTTAFALLDVISGDEVLNRVTRGTACLHAERTFFLRVVLLLTTLYTELDYENTIRGSLTSAKSSGVVPAALRTSAAASVFEGWIDALAASYGFMREDWTHDRAVKAVAASLSYTTVGVLQELCFVLQRCERSEEQAAAVAAQSNDDASVRTAEEESLPSPLVQALRRLLKAVPVDETFSAPPQPVSTQTLLTTPAALQWRQLREAWPLAERETFARAALTDTFLGLAAPHTSTATVEAEAAVNEASPTHESSVQNSETALCMGYHDFKVMENFCRSTAEEVAAAHVHEVLSRLINTSRADHNNAAASPSPSLRTLLHKLNKRDTAETDATERCRVQLLHPLEEVDWWLQYNSKPRTLEENPSSHGSDKSICSLSKLVQISVPPVLGCPTHSWTSPATPQRGASQNQISSVSAPTEPPQQQQPSLSVAMYWLQRWVDAVEDGRPLPHHTYFRSAVKAEMEKAAFATSLAAEDTSGDAVADGRGEPIDGAFTRRGRDSVEGGGDQSEDKPDQGLRADKVRAKRDGVEELLVRGPASLLYDSR